MKKVIAITTLVAATSASAFFGGNDNGFGNSNGMSNWGPFDGGSNFGPMNSGSNMGPFTGVQNIIFHKAVPF
jgi:hypothetical protein